jgi:Fe-S-cluster containining protein
MSPCINFILLRIFNGFGIMDCKDCGMCCYGISSLKFTVDEYNKTLIKFPQKASLFDEVAGFYYLRNNFEWCPFYDASKFEKRCMIHDSRPYICRIFPVRFEYCAEEFYQKLIVDYKADFYEDLFFVFCPNSYSLNESDMKSFVEDMKNTVISQDYLYHRIDGKLNELATAMIKYKDSYEKSKRRTFPGYFHLCTYLEYKEYNPAVVSLMKEIISYAFVDEEFALNFLEDITAEIFFSEEKSKLKLKEFRKKYINRS